MKQLYTTENVRAAFTGDGCGGDLLVQTTPRGGPCELAGLGALVVHGMGFVVHEVEELHGEKNNHTGSYFQARESSNEERTIRPNT